MILTGWERQKTHIGAAPSGALECRALAELMAEAKLLPGHNGYLSRDVLFIKAAPGGVPVDRSVQEAAF
jgi:hypothetical protein